VPPGSSQRGGEDPGIGFAAPLPEATVSDVGLEEKVAFLRRPESYPHRPDAVEAVETHMAWVFLAGSEAYKLKKPVRYDFLDFATLEARRRHCEEEVRLNRRLAPDVYRGVVAMRRTLDGSLTLDGAGRVVEWLVHMRRLPRDRMLDALIRSGGVTEAQVEKVVLRLVRFFERAPHVELSADEYRARFRRDIHASRRELETLSFEEPGGIETPVPDAGAIAGRLLDFLSGQAALLDARVTAGRIVEGHGDLRAEHICLEEEPVIIDCLEFNPDFRIIDPADEISFLAVECSRLGARWLGEDFLERYRRRSGDRPPAELVAFYESFRAFLRARIAIWHVRDDAIRDHGKWVRRSRAYLDLAAAFLPVA
jgi:aminoglycoside phosphotransferase family enzyme